MVAMDVEPGMAAGPPRMTPLKGLGVLMGIVVVIAGFIFLCSALRSSELYAGFLFLLCWSALAQNKMEKLPQTALGAAFGLGLGIAMQMLMAGPLGLTGALIFGAIILVVIYSQIMGWLQLLINFTTMTFLTVMTIPHIQSHGDFRGMAIALATGIVYFAAVIRGVGWLTSRSPRKA
jgi:hypothetical protein